MYYLIAKIYLYKHRLIHPIGDKCLFYVPGKYFFTQEVDFEFSKDDNENSEYVQVPDIA